MADGISSFRATQNIDGSIVLKPYVEIALKDSWLAKQFKEVRRALGKLHVNPRHPGQNTHTLSAMPGPNGEDVSEAYPENNTADACRIFGIQGPGKDAITIVAITAHP